MERANKFQDLLNDFLSELIKSRDAMKEKHQIKIASDEVIESIASLTDQIDFLLGEFSIDNEPQNQENLEDNDIDELESNERFRSSREDARFSSYPYHSCPKIE